MQTGRKYLKKFYYEVQLMRVEMKLDTDSLTELNKDILAKPILK